MDKENDLIKQTLKEYISVLIDLNKKLILENKNLKKQIKDLEEGDKDLKNSIRHIFK